MQWHQGITAFLVFVSLNVRTGSSSGYGSGRIRRNSSNSGRYTYNGSYEGIAGSGGFRGDYQTYGRTAGSDGYGGNRSSQSFGGYDDRSNRGSQVHGSFINSGSYNDGTSNRNYSNFLYSGQEYGGGAAGSGRNRGGQGYTNFVGSRDNGYGQGYRNNGQGYENHRNFRGQNFSNAATNGSDYNIGSVGNNGNLYNNNRLNGNYSHPGPLRNHENPRNYRTPGIYVDNTDHRSYGQNIFPSRRQGTPGTYGIPESNVGNANNTDLLHHGGPGSYGTFGNSGNYGSSRDNARNFFYGNNWVLSGNRTYRSTKNIED